MTKLYSEPLFGDVGGGFCYLFCILGISDHVQCCSMNCEIVPLSLLFSLKLRIGLDHPVYAYYFAFGHG